MTDYTAMLATVETSEAEAEPIALRRGRVTWASDIEPEPVEWFWRDGDACRIPTGSLTVFAGREGTAKSTFALHMAAQTTRGTLPGSLHGEPSTALVVAVEDSWKHTLVPRLIAADADLARVGRFDVVTSVGETVTLSLPHDLAVLEQTIFRHEVRLVVIDPLMSVIGDRIDTHREREVREALDPLAQMADRTGAVIVAIAHFNKSTGTDAANLITGSGAFKNVPRSVFGFAKDPQGDRVLTQVKNSLGRDELPSLSYVVDSVTIPTEKGAAETGRLRFTGISDRTVAEVLRDAHRDPEAFAQGRDAASWIAQYLADAGGGAPSADVLAAGHEAGYSDSTLKHARRRVATTEKIGLGGGWYWVLIPKGADQGAEGAGTQTVASSAPSEASLGEIT